MIKRRELIAGAGALIMITAFVLAKSYVKPSNDFCLSHEIDCGGIFYDVGGHPVRVPPFQSLTQSDDVKRWKEAVAAFYRGVYSDSALKCPLSNGKAALCTTWATMNLR